MGGDGGRKDANWIPHILRTKRMGKKFQMGKKVSRRGDSGGDRCVDHPVQRVVWGETQKREPQSPGKKRTLKVQTPKNREDKRQVKG